MRISLYVPPEDEADLKLVRKHLESSGRSASQFFLAGIRRKAIELRKQRPKKS